MVSALIETNAIVQIALRLVTEFCGRVPLPEGAWPTNQAMVSSVAVAPDNSPVVVFTARNGARFVVSDGSVKMAQTTNSFFRLQDPGLVPAFRGRSIMSDDEVISESRKILEKLSGGRFTPYGHPALEQPTGEIPFAQVKWRESQLSGSDAATVEFDAGRGRVVYLELNSTVFNREDVASEMRRYVQIEKQQRKRPLAGLPVSEANAGLIYRDFERLSVALGTPIPATMSLQNVDWNASFHITNSTEISGRDCWQDLFR